VKRLSIIETATGRVVGEWRGDDEGALARTPGYSYVPLPRIVSPVEFARRFTMREEVAIDTLAETDRTVRAWMRRLSLATLVDLDHPDVLAGLAYLRLVGIPVVWPDAATADQRIQEIRS